jgi:hypothetical protein
MEHSNKNTAGNGDRGVMDRVKQGAAAQLSSQKDRATDGLGSLAQAVRRTTQPLRENDQVTLAEYVEKAADRLERFSSDLRQRDLGDLVNEAQRFARRQPALFIGGAFAAGVLAARFLKSSPEHRPGDWRRHEQAYPQGAARTRALAPGYSGGPGYGTGGA